jgi:hypothetical protein
MGVAVGGNALACRVQERSCFCKGVSVVREDDGGN